MDILIYFNKGVDSFAFRQAYKTLKKMLRENDRLIAVKPQTLLEHLEHADLFVIPGGRDVFYHEALKGEKIRAIRTFVENGGNYLGFCGGAYFGAQSIEFEKGNLHEVIAQRELAFFPHRAIGSALGLGKYEPTSCRGADCALIDTEMGSFATYYNGGCYFEDKPALGVTSLAQFAKTHENAIVECLVGKGKALLSGVHLEYSAEDIAEKQLPREKIEKLKQDEAIKSQFLKTILNRMIPTTKLNV